MTDGDEYDEEVTALFRRLGGRLRGYLINMGATPGLADEIVNDAFAAVRLRWDRLRVGRPDIFLHVVARHEYFKRQGKRTEQPEDLSGDVPEILGTAISDHSGRIVDHMTLRWALEQLSVRERETVLLRYIGGHNVAETAKIMNIRVGTVKRYTSNGLRKLRKLIGDSTSIGEVGDR